VSNLYSSSLFLPYPYSFAFYFLAYGEGTRHGKEPAEGFDSHYVIINKEFTPCQQDEAIYQDEIVVFSKPSVLPRYMVYFSRAHRIREAASATPISDKQALLGDEVGALNEGPVVIHVDPNPLDVLNLIEVEPSIRVSVYNFHTTMEALTYMHRHKDELIARKRENILRVITNRNRNSDDGGEQAGEELVRKLRADADWKSLPMLIYCRQTQLVQLKPQRSSGVWFSVTGDAKVAFDFCIMAPLEGVPRHLWNFFTGPLLIVGIKSGQGFQQQRTFGGRRGVYCVVKVREARPFFFLLLLPPFSLFLQFSLLSTFRSFTRSSFLPLSSVNTSLFLPLLFSS
jgi:hypothetical protein